MPPSLNDRRDSCFAASAPLARTGWATSSSITTAERTRTKASSREARSDAAVAGGEHPATDCRPNRRTAKPLTHAAHRLNDGARIMTRLPPAPARAGQGPALSWARVYEGPSLNAVNSSRQVS
ncbi:hypothetical protein MFU01_10910 [Myxococcus fulvus]|uniref:Uncharacterized protein n=1 Tax=Myxococcus fulvus TaxID=33 RepID=A0A511SVX5_MYXFU|nr:hypothetical protein MFU01_10910 [Myxococcus fulvus]